MASVSDSKPARRRKLRNSTVQPRTANRQSSGWGVIFALLTMLGGGAAVYFVLQWHAAYTVNLQSPVKVSLAWPLVIAKRADNSSANEAQQDQQHPLTAYQQYACRKFGSGCRVALAIQRAENPQGKCEIYHYNSDGTLDWGYFQINTVHLQRKGLVLRDLLDCRANIDFAYQLYVEHHGFTPWSSYNSGAYRKFLHE